MPKFQIIRKYLPWIGGSLLLPLAIVIAIRQSSTVVEEAGPKTLPPRLHGMQVFPGFEQPPLKCIQNYRWPNKLEFCEYQVSGMQDAEVVRFYQRLMSNLNWKMRDASQEGWKSPMADSEVIVFFSNEDIHFFIEKSLKRDGVYRVLFSNMLNTRKNQ